jgi:hypothetical protein
LKVLLIGKKISNQGKPKKNEKRFFKKIKNLKNIAILLFFLKKNKL